MGKLGRFPLLITVIEDVVKYWFRLKQVKEASLLDYAYKLEMGLHEKHQSIYLDFVHSVFSFCNCSHFIVGENYKLSTILKKVKDSLKSKFINMWKKSVASNNKLHVYSKIKLTFQREKY